MNVLWSRFDGAHAASRLAARLGLTATTDPADPTQWGEMRVSAADHLLIYGHVLDLPGPDRDLLVDALAAAPDIARDGFAQDFGLLAGDLDAGRAAAKQGWMCCFGQRYHLHSVGLLGPDQRFVVALLSTAPQAPGWDEARAHLDEVAGAIGEVLASAA